MKQRIGRLNPQARPTQSNTFFPEAPASGESLVRKAKRPLAVAALLACAAGAAWAQAAPDAAPISHAQSASGLSFSERVQQATMRAASSQAPTKTRAQPADTSATASSESFAAAPNDEVPSKAADTQTAKASDNFSDNAAQGGGTAVPEPAPAVTPKKSAWPRFWQWLSGSSATETSAAQGLIHAEPSTFAANSDSASPNNGPVAAEIEALPPTQTLGFGPGDPSAAGSPAVSKKFATGETAPAEKPPEQAENKVQDDGQKEVPDKGGQKDVDNEARDPAEAAPKEGGGPAKDASAASGQAAAAPPQLNTPLSAVFSLPYTPSELALVAVQVDGSWVEVYQTPAEGAQSAVELLNAQEVPTAVGLIVDNTLHATSAAGETIEAALVKYEVLRQNRPVAYDIDCREVPQKGDVLQAEFKQGSYRVTLQGTLLVHYVFGPETVLNTEPVRLPGLTEDNCHLVQEQRLIYEGVLEVQNEDKLVSRADVVFQSLTQD